MTEAQAELLAKAHDSLAAAKLLLENGYPDYAASRAYYVMFYSAEAFLEGEGMAFSKHSAVIAAFGKEFVKTGRVSQNYHRYLVDAEDLRHVADYGPRRSVESDRAALQIEHAEMFFELAQTMIGTAPYKDV